DTATTMELTELLGSLHRAGATLVVITHNPVVAAHAQRQVAIRDGTLTELAPPRPGGRGDTSHPRAEAGDISHLPAGPGGIGHPVPAGPDGTRPLPPEAGN